MREHEELLEGIEEEAIKEELWWKKYLVKALVVIVVIGVIIYSVFATETYSAVRGLLVSSTLDGAKLSNNGITVVFENNTISELQREYLSNQEREIKACLKGSIENGIYHMREISFPEVISATVIHITTYGCDADTLIDLHSHPINRCFPSDVDFDGFREQKKINPDLVLAVMCSKDRFYLVKQ